MTGPSGILHMRKITVFYAWQSDTPPRFNCYLIRMAVEAAARRINDDPALDIALHIDSDTQGVPGQPPVTETILKKIEACNIFCPDLTFVAQTDVGKFMPNANVMVEYGYALHAKTHAAMLPVMNTAHGPPEKLPFDMGHLRHPIQYHASPTVTNAERRAARKVLTEKIEAALRLTLASHIGPTRQEDYLEKAREFTANRINLVQAGGFLPTVLVLGPRLFLHVFPLFAFQDRAVIDHVAMRRLCWRFKPAHYENFHDRTNIEGWHLWQPPKPLPPPLIPMSSWCSTITNSGIAEIVETLVPVAQDATPPAIKGYPLEADIVATLDQLADGYAALGITSPAILKATLLGVQGVYLERSRPGPLQGFDRPFIALPEVRLERIAKPVGNFLRPMFDALWRAAGCSDGSQSFNRGEWSGYGEGRIRCPLLHPQQPECLIRRPTEPKSSEVSMS
jgi:hypothetical protein